METGSNSQQKAVVKKQQQQEKNRDRISYLPVKILHHIFSFVDMKLAVKTCILSKRWRYFWTRLPHLNFTNSVHLYQEKTHKLDLVDRVFVLRRTSSKIQSLHLNIGSTPAALPSLNVIKGHLNTWILAALQSSVENLSIEISFDTFYELHSRRSKRKTSSIIKEEVDPDLFKFPDCLFTSKRLMSLMLKTDRRQHFKTCLFPAANSTMSLPLLKTLHLASLKLEGNDFITKLFSSCPVLESLIIKDCEFHCCSSTGINISSFKLKHLVIDKCSMISPAAADHHQPVEIEFKLNALFLISLSITDCMSKDYTLENLYSIKKANIDMAVKVEEEDGVHRNSTSTTQLELPEERKRLYARRMVKFLKALENVKDLTLSPWMIEVFSGTADLLEIRCAWFWNLRCLELKTWFSRDCIHSIAYLLNRCHRIETLSIEVTRKNPTESMRWDQTNLDSLNSGDYWEPRPSTICIMPDRLKVVKLRGYLGCNELKFLQFLLKNASVLERLTIGFSYNGYIPDQKKRVTKFAEMLHAYPRASSRLRIMFL